jgi:hypothetical protein
MLSRRKTLEKTLYGYYDRRRLLSQAASFYGVYTLLCARDGVSPLDDTNQDQDDGEKEEKVYEPAERVGRDEAKTPKNEK